MAPTVEQLTQQLSPPRHSNTVHREECTQCFDTQDSPLGIDVCLSCYNGGCPKDSFNQHSVQHFRKSGHAIFVNIRRVRKPKQERDTSEPPVKKLAIREESPENERYDFHTTPRQLLTNCDLQDLVATDLLENVIQSVMASMSSARKSEVKAWEEELVSCQHTTDLVQQTPMAIQSGDLAICSYDGCGLTNNLWLCLTCGSLACGRQQFGGGGGKGHGLQHKHETGHSVAIKMGTIEPDGSADVYCYACDDARLDPKLAKHLANFSIEVSGQKKTEKSMTELQIEQNMTYDFAMTGEDGKELEPLMGPGLTGLQNLGNSCYIASSLQTVLALPLFQELYLTSFFTHSPACTVASPADCFQCQMNKMADGLLSGRYAKVREPQETSDKHPLEFQEGIRPIMFKSLVGRDHPEFSTMKQQDASEFLLYLFEIIRRSAKATLSEDPTAAFGFSLEEKIQCTECRRVRYLQTDQEFLPITVPIAKKTPTSNDKTSEYIPVELIACLNKFTATSTVEYRCPACERTVTATKTNQFHTFPDYLLINAARFEHVNWVPRKVDVPLILPAQGLDLSGYLGKGKQDGEVDLPEAEAEASAPAFNPSFIAQLTEMGFPEIRAQRALLAVGNNSAENAMNWLFEHMEDPDIDAPLVNTALPANTTVNPSDEQISMVTDMGFTSRQAKKALKVTGGDVASAVEWLFSHPDDMGEEPEEALPSSNHTASATPQVRGSSKLPAQYRLKAFISHKGPSIHSGHYVAHVWKGEETGWVLFNDEKVVKAEGGEQSAEKLMALAYVYLYERVE